MNLSMKPHTHIHGRMKIETYGFETLPNWLRWYSIRSTKIIKGKLFVCSDIVRWNNNNRKNCVESNFIISFFLPCNMDSINDEQTH